MYTWTDKGCGATLQGAVHVVAQAERLHCMNYPLRTMQTTRRTPKSPEGGPLCCQVPPAPGKGCGCVMMPGLHVHVCRIMLCLQKAHCHCWCDFHLVLECSKDDSADNQQPCNFGQQQAVYMYCSKHGHCMHALQYFTATCTDQLPACCVFWCLCVFVCACCIPLLCCCVVAGSV
jgi:hypothetical protein